MIEQNARVLTTEGEFAWVEAERKSACGGCEAKAGCGTGSLSKAFGTRANRMKVLNRAEAKPGDAVIIGIEESALVQGSAAVYLVPLVVLLAGGLFGEFMAERLGFAIQVGGVIGGLSGLAIGMWWLRRYSENVQMDPRFQPVILKVLPKVIPITELCGKG